MKQELEWVEEEEVVECELMDAGVGEAEWDLTGVEQDLMEDDEQWVE